MGGIWRYDHDLAPEKTAAFNMKLPNIPLVYIADGCIPLYSVEASEASEASLSAKDSQKERMGWKWFKARTENFLQRLDSFSVIIRGHLTSQPL